MPDLSQLIASAARLAGDPSGLRWLQAIADPPVLGTNDWQYLLNEGTEVLNRLSGVYRVAMPMTVTAEVATAPLLDARGSPPYGRILRVEDQNGRGLIRATAGEMDVLVGRDWEKVAPGQPTRWIRGLDPFGIIRLWPPPRDDGAYKVWCVARPIPMLASAALPFIGTGPDREASAEQYHYLIPYYASAVALTWNRNGQDLALSQQYEQKFQAGAQEAAAEVTAAMEP